ncbi:unnamed protein product [Rotaria magnacalcarata]|uniref:Uncharacterized protein n=1 Tax=Rotaria magnacalcarata TaxID=392030 RepID=A0A816XU72_9BILA|nr:unnamed protein product [Rotaria magnacalcarata]
MILWIVCLLIKSIESSHSLNPSDLSCKKRICYVVFNLIKSFHNHLGDYRLITDQSSHIITVDNPLSRLLTKLWREQINDQPLIFQSSRYFLNYYRWTLKFSSIINQSDFFFDAKPILNKQIDLIIKNSEKKQEDFCSYPDSPIKIAVCCGLCTITDVCSEIKIRHEHSRYDMIVTNVGLILMRELICSLFPTNQTNRFWSTITNSMNVGQIPDKNDLAIIQHSYGTIQAFFYYTLYPFHEWNKQIVNFNFIDVLFIPYKQFAIFELNDCNRILLRVYEYRLNKTIQLTNQLFYSEIIIERNICSTTYFHLYFSMLSNMLYLIGQQSIYASNNYGAKLIRIWTDDISSNDSIILDPIIFSDTGHLAFIYQRTNHSSCCYYFGIFSKAGLYYGLRTRTFRSSVLMKKPFFFDSSGSFYFNASPPLLVIQATEQSLAATRNLLVNNVPGPFFVRETDMNRFFVFCSLTKWDNRFELSGSTLQFEKVGLFFIINMDTSFSKFGFCLQTSRLDNNLLRTSRQCPLTIQLLGNTSSIHLTLLGCVFTTEDQNSTIIISKFPNIFIDRIFNETFAAGRIFQEAQLNYTCVNQWNIIHIQIVEQILDRCLLTNIDSNYHRSSFMHIQPAITYPMVNGDQLVTENFYFLSQNGYTFYENKMDNNLYLMTSLFNHRKSIIHQDFIRSQLSCYLPSMRTITFVTKCLTNTIIRPKFEISKLVPIESPINFQLNRYQAGFPSVIVYNIDQEKNLICDGFKNCSCISSLISHHSIHCAQQFYTIDLTINNRIYMELWMENDIVYLANNNSIFLVEEVSNRKDYKLIENSWTMAMKEKMIDLFVKDFNHLTDNEIRIFELLNKSLQSGKFIFLGPSLKLEFMDEGLYHLRLTYLWGDQFCLTSVDLLILMISNTATLTSYTFTYFLACIFILILMEAFFTSRSTNDHINFKMLVKIREQSQKLLPYEYLISERNNFKKK